jgi:hypothetical protein
MTTVSSLVCLETRVGKDDNEPLGVLVRDRNGSVLFGDQSW